MHLPDHQRDLERLPFNPLVFGQLFECPAFSGEGSESPSDECEPVAIRTVIAFRCLDAAVADTPAIVKLFTLDLYDDAELER